jgi:ubiquinone/menaquinone biosynthesis C-methylase UbiE
MPQHTCLEETLSNALMRNKFYRLLFVKFTGIFDLKNLIIKRAFKAWVKNKKPENLKVLDVGFGFGQQIHYLLDIVPNATVLGIDVSDKAVTCVNKYFIPQKYPNIYCKRKDILEFEGNEAFDLVLAFKLLNYVKNDLEAIRKMYASLKPGGTLLVLNQHATRPLTTASFDNIHTLPLMRSGYTMHELRDLLKDAGFTTVKCRYVYGPTGQLAWKIAIGVPLKITRISPLLLPLAVLYTILTTPLVLALNYYDLKIGHTSGQSIFLKAEK